jgi:hypothetical protein
VHYIALLIGIAWLLATRFFNATTGIAKGRIPFLVTINQTIPV